MEIERSKKQQVFELLEQGKSRERIITMLPHVKKETINTYVGEWIRKHTETVFLKAGKQDKPSRKRVRKKEEPKKPKDTVRYCCGSGARFGASSVFWKKG